MRRGRGRGPAPVLPPEIVATIRRRAAVGDGHSRIARELGLSLGQVREHTKDFAPRRRGAPPRIDPAVVQQIRSSYAGGARVADIARAHGVSTRYVRDLVRGVLRVDAVPLPKPIQDAIDAAKAAGVEWTPAEQRWLEDVCGALRILGAGVRRAKP